MQLSGGPYSYNRFDAYEQELKEQENTGGSAYGWNGTQRYEIKTSGMSGEGDERTPADRQKEREEYKEKQAAKRAPQAKKEADANARREKDLKLKAAREKLNAQKNEEVELFFIEDEAGNIYEGKKDACYHKVKSRYMYGLLLMLLVH